MSAAAISYAHQPLPMGPHTEGRVVLHGVPWWMYVALRDSLDSSGSGVRMTYLDGELELMSPSNLHEEAKTIIARLIEIWAVEKMIDLRGFGSTTFRKEAKRGGLEPDECYKLGPIEGDGVPDIAIEVNVSRSHLNKLEVYRRLGVSEVWGWESSTKEIVIHRATPEGYVQASASVVLADLDIALLARFVRPGENQTQLSIAYRDALRET
ncbi:Uma2 family endonuclease [Pendulispora albinea]|uniref:Uma2 family endonuclease n=1 Tax=Pendulispora albinea TaxID=2741071 RepID=A0ABZ2LIR8_9BACT